jgi:hypothetical protein
MSTELSTAKLKVTCGLQPQEILKISVPHDKPRVVLTVRLPDRVLTAELAAKSVRKAQQTIRDAGAENVFAMLQGTLIGDAITDAGLVAQVKTPKPTT